MDTTLIVVTLLSLLVAAAMSAVALRTLRDERLRSVARIAALAADIHDDPMAAQRSAPARVAVDDLLLRDGIPVPSPGQMFMSAQARPVGWRLVQAVAVGALVVGAAVAAAIVFGDRGSGAGVIDSESSNMSERSSGAERRISPIAPLELVALGHERDADGLTVRGVLRNPPAGSELGQLTAVVLVFNRDGVYIASGRAAVHVSALGPGGEATFVVTVSGAPDVERYRVSFRTEHDVLPHVDLRS